MLLLYISYVLCVPRARKIGFHKEESAFICRVEFTDDHVRTSNREANTDCEDNSNENHQELMACHTPRKPCVANRLDSDVFKSGLSSVTLF